MRIEKHFQKMHKDVGMVMAKSIKTVVYLTFCLM